MKFPENASFLSPKQVNWCGIAPYFAVNTQIRPGTATGAEKPKTKLVIGFSSEQPAAPPACIAGRPILPVIKFEQKLTVKIRLSSNMGGLGGFCVQAGTGHSYSIVAIRVFDGQNLR